jgi:hypothetical protein
LRLLHIDSPVAKVKRSTGLGEGDFFVTPTADDLNVLVVFVIYDFVEARILADACELLDAGLKS